MKNELFAVPIILSDDETKILLCKNAERNFYFLPILPIEPGFRIEEKLIQYFEKNFGQKITSASFTGCIENIFDDTHQFLFVFKLSDHILSTDVPNNGFIYRWIEISQINHIFFEPAFLKSNIQSWLKGEMVFFSTNEEIYYV